MRDGNLMTGGGVTAGIDFALALIAEVAGREVAEAIELSLEYAPAPPFNAGSPETAPPRVAHSCVSAASFDQISHADRHEVGIRHR